MSMHRITILTISDKLSRSTDVQHTHNPKQPILFSNLQMADIMTRHPAIDVDNIFS